MRFCPKCGEALADGQRFCKKCGAPVRAEGPIPSTSIESAEKSKLSDDKWVEQVAKVEETSLPEKGARTEGEAKAEQSVISPQPSEPAAKKAMITMSPRKGPGHEGTGARS